MPRLIREYWDLQERIYCVREGNFAEMYECLGDEAAQQKIRKKNADQPHCRYLRESSRACIALPVSAPPEHVGEPCPNNPFHKHKEEIADMEESIPRVLHALRLFDEHELGLTPKPLTVYDFEVLRATKETVEARRRKLLAQELAAKIAELFGERKT